MTPHLWLLYNAGKRMNDRREFIAGGGGGGQCLALGGLNFILNQRIRLAHTRSYSLRIAHSQAQKFPRAHRLGLWMYSLLSDIWLPCTNRHSFVSQHLLCVSIF